MALIEVKAAVEVSKSGEVLKDTVFINPFYIIYMSPAFQNVNLPDGTVKQINYLSIRLLNEVVRIEESDVTPELIEKFAGV